jgi:hypothetical protein
MTKFQRGDIVTSNGSDRAVIIYANNGENYGEAEYRHGGHAFYQFRIKLSDYRKVGSVDNNE